MMSLEERDSIFICISELKEMNRMINNQARKIENREGKYWKNISAEEIEKKVFDYDYKIENNNNLIKYYWNKLAIEYDILCK